MSRKATVRDLTGSEWRRKKRGGEEVLQRHRRTKIIGSYETFTPQKLIDKAGELAYEDSEFEVDVEHEYGEDYPGIFLDGWSDATPEEITKALHEAQMWIDRREQRDAEDLERLKKTHPELFKEP